MEVTDYKVTCKACSGSDVLKITKDNTVFYTNHIPIIAARFRPDLKWGFECMCGQDSRLAKEESPHLEMLVKNASPSIIDNLREGLKEDKPKFEMERV